MINTSIDIDRRRAPAAGTERAVRTRLAICVSAFVLMSVTGSDAAPARTSHVTPRNVAMDANASTYPTTRYVHRPIGILTLRVGAFTLSPTPSDRENCDVGDSPHIC
jgi:hypothetical protein